MMVRINQHAFPQDKKPIRLHASLGIVVDAVLMPVAPHAAVIPGKYYHTGMALCSLIFVIWNSPSASTAYVPLRLHGKQLTRRFWQTAYTEAINLMDYSAAVIPVTTANKEIDVFDKDYEPLNETDRKNWEACEYSSVTS
jgi:amidase